METLPADIQRKIALELSPADLFKLYSDDTFKENICESRTFWLSKLAKDYPDMLNYYNRHGMKIQNPKNTYIRKFTKFSEAVEKFVNEWYLPEERQEKYNLIYNLYKEWTSTPIYSDKIFWSYPPFPIHNYPSLLISPRENAGFALNRLLTSFMKEEEKYKY